MNININIEKKHVWFILIAISLFGGIIVAVAQTPPNPGHGADRIGPGLFNGDFSFNRKVNMDIGNSNDFLDIVSSSSLSHIALISNKPEFGVWVRPLSRWADIRATNFVGQNLILTGGISAAGGISSTGQVSGLTLRTGTVSLFTRQGTGTCSSQCGGISVCLGAWKWINPFTQGSTNCADSAATQCLCAQPA